MKLANQLLELIKYCYAKEKNLCVEDDNFVAKFFVGPMRKAETDEKRFEILCGFISSPLLNVINKIRINSYAQFLAFEENELQQIKGVGAKRVREFALLKRVLEGLISEQDESKKSEPLPKDDDKLPVPSKILEKLSTRARHVLYEIFSNPKVGQVRGLNLQILDRQKGAGRKTIDELLGLARLLQENIIYQEDIVNTFAEIDPVSPNGCSSLEEFVLKICEKVGLDVDERIRQILADRMGVLNQDSVNSLEAIGESLGVTRERVRQMTMRAERILFKQGYEYFNTFISQVVGLLNDNKWIVTSKSLGELVDGVFGWRETSGNCVSRILMWLQKDVEIYNGEICVYDFANNLQRRYKAFISYVNEPGRLLSDIIEESMLNSSVAKNERLTHLEYYFYARKGMAIDFTVEQYNCKFHSFQKDESEITSTGVRQYFAFLYDLKLSSNRNVGLGWLRRSIVRDVLYAAGVDGMTLSEISDRCKEMFPQIDWSEGAIRGYLCNGVILDETRNERLIGLERGTKGNSRTKYSISSLFKDKKNIELLHTAGEELKAHMEKTGIGVSRVWRIWHKYRDKFSVPIPKLGFYMLLRDLQAGGLTYQDYPHILYPGIQQCDAISQWALYEYFMICGKQQATSQEMYYFMVDVLGMQPSVAYGNIFSTGRTHIEDDEETLYQVQAPNNNIRPPDIFLPSVVQYRDFSLIKVPKNRHIQPYYLDEDGKALTHGVYVKLFMDSLERSGFALPEGELAGLTDAGWCNNVFKFNKRVLKPTRELTWSRDCGYYKTPFLFNEEEYFLATDWSSRNKYAFDQWATRIARMASLSFQPYDIIGVQDVAE